MLSRAQYANLVLVTLSQFLSSTDTVCVRERREEISQQEKLPNKHLLLLF